MVPGFALMRAINSLGVLTFKPMVVTIKVGELATKPMGSKSVTGSYLSFCNAGLMPWVAM